MNRVVSGWIREGSFRYREDVTEGLASAPEAFCRLMRGGNFGKALVKVAPETRLSASACLPPDGSS